MQAEKSREAQPWYLQIIPLIPIVCALGLLFYTTNVRSQAQHKEEERNALKALYVSLGLPADATPGQVDNRISAIERDTEEAKLARVAKKLGTGSDWSKIFQRIEQMHPAEQADALRTIAAEYQLPASISAIILKRFVMAKQMTHLGSLTTTAVSAD